MAEHLEIIASERERLAPQGLTTVSGFLDGSAGREISAQPGADVRRLKLGEGAGFYLKRRHREGVWRLLGMLIYGRRPHSGPLRELMMVRALKKAGFEAMEPVAWGERTVLGIPRAGFLLVREIPGRSVSEVYDEAAGAGRRALMEKLGELIGRLQGAGFLHPVRLKDLILTPERRLVLIDRETSKPWPTKFSVRGGVRSLARATRRTLRDGHRIGPGSARAFVRGYEAGLAGKMPLDHRRLTRELMKALRSELSSKRR